MSSKQSSFKFESKTYGENNKKVIFFLAGWKTVIQQYWIISRLLELNGYRCITYSYSHEILSPDVNSTLKNIIAVKKDILKQIRFLKKEGIKTFYIFGNSIGALISLMVANESPDVSKVVLNVVGADLAETVWSWGRVERLKYFKNELLQQKLTLPRLKKVWESIAPINNTKKLHGKKILIYTSDHDELIPFDLGQRLAKKLKKDYGAKVIERGYISHVISIIINLFKTDVYLSFLKS